MIDEVRTPVEVKMRGVLPCLIGYGIFGFSFLFSKAVLEVTTPFTLLAFRFFIAFLVLNIIRLIKKIPLSFRSKPVGKLLLLGVIQPLIYYMCETYGIALTSTSMTGAVIGMGPIAGLILGAVLQKKRCTIPQFLCAFVSVAGTILAADPKAGQFSFAGLLCLLAALFSSAAFTILSKDIAEQFSSFERTYIMFAFGSAAFLIAAFLQNHGSPKMWIFPLTSAHFWISIFYLAVISSVCAYMLINASLNVISAEAALVISNFASVISILSGIFILKDQTTKRQLLGIILIIISVVGSTIQMRAMPYAEKK